MNVLVLCDDRWHPAQTVRLGLQSLSAQEFYFVWLEDARAWSPAFNVHLSGCNSEQI
jgi:hypothetical protein